jgi:hypothetical protein
MRRLGDLRWAFLYWNCMGDRSRQRELPYISSSQKESRRSCFAQILHREVSIFQL